MQILFTSNGHANVYFRRVIYFQFLSDFNIRDSGGTCDVRTMEVVVSSRLVSPERVTTDVGPDWQVASAETDSLSRLLRPSIWWNGFRDLQLQNRLKAAVSTATIPGLEALVPVHKLKTSYQSTQNIIRGSTNTNRKFDESRLDDK